MDIFDNLIGQAVDLVLMLRWIITAWLVGVAIIWVYVYGGRYHE